MITAQSRKFGALISLFLSQKTMRKKQRANHLGRLVTEIESVITYIRALNDVNGSTSRPLISVIKRITIGCVGWRVHVIRSVFDWIRFLFSLFCFLPRLSAYDRHWIPPKMRLRRVFAPNTCSVMRAYRKSQAATLFHCNGVPRKHFLMRLLKKTFARIR